MLYQNTKTLLVSWQNFEHASLSRRSLIFTLRMWFYLELVCMNTIARILAFQIGTSAYLFISVRTVWVVRTAEGIYRVM